MRLTTFGTECYATIFHLGFGDYYQLILPSKTRYPEQFTKMMRMSVEAFRGIDRIGETVNSEKICCERTNLRGRKISTHFELSKKLNKKISTFFEDIFFFFYCQNVTFFLSFVFCLSSESSP